MVEVRRIGLNEWEDPNTQILFMGTKCSCCGAEKPTYSLKLGNFWSIYSLLVCEKCKAELLKGFQENTKNVKLLEGAINSRFVSWIFSQGVLKTGDIAEVIFEDGDDYKILIDGMDYWIEKKYCEVVE